MGEEVAEEEVVAAGRESVARVCGAGIPGTPLYSYKIITGTEALLVQNTNTGGGEGECCSSHTRHTGACGGTSGPVLRYLRPHTPRYLRAGTEVLKASLVCVASVSEELKASDTSSLRPHTLGA